MRQQAPIIVATLTGEVDLSNVHQVRDDVLRAVPNSASALVLDLTETSYLDSQGIGMLLHIVHRLSIRRQQTLLVVPDQTRVRKLLALLSIASSMPYSAQRGGSSAHAGGARHVVDLAQTGRFPAPRVGSAGLNPRAHGQKT
ncbi:MAG: STAS domain-containing protein [Armatimonadota bacterium]